MAGNGYTYRSVATYNTVREESRPQGPGIKPFVPFVPNTNSNSDGYVTRKTIVPVASRPPYDDDDDDNDDYKKQSSPTDEWHRQKNPARGTPRKVDEFLTKVQNESSRPQRSSPATSTDWRHRATSFNNPDGYGDYGGNKERRKPIESTIRDDSYDSPNGYGNYNKKQGHKPSSSPTRNDKYDGYDDGGNNGYGGYHNYDNKEGRRPYGDTTKSDKYDGYNGGNGYGDYGNYNNKEGYKPTSSLVWNDKYDGYDGANNGYGGGYGNYNNKEGHMPYGSTTKDNNYDGYNGGKGYGNYNKKEGHKPSSSPTQNDNYDRLRPAGNYSVMDPNRNILSGLTKPKVSTAWTAPPRKGTQLSEPTSDIGKAIELLKEAAVTPSDHRNKGGHKTTSTALPYDSYGNYQCEQASVDKPTPSNNWAAALANDSRLGKPRSKVDKSMDPMKEVERLKKLVTPIKDDYGETNDKKDAASRYGNLNFSSKPHTTPTPTHVTFIDGREPNYRGDTSRSNGNTSGPVIDSRYAQKKYGGERI